MTSNDQGDLDAGLQAAIDLFQDQHLTEAIFALKKLVRRFPDSAKLWGYLGFLHREGKELKAAVRCFQHAVVLSPKSERASLGLFYSLWRSGRFNDALKEMTRFAATGQPKAYLGLLSGRASEGVTRTSRGPTLLKGELREAEAAYLDVEAHPETSLTEIDDAQTLRELVDA